MRAGYGHRGASDYALPVPEAAQDAELLTAAAVALNRHADVLRELGALFAARRPRAVSGRRLGARRGAAAAESPIWTSPPTRAPSSCRNCCGRGPTRCGTPVSSSAPSAPRRATSGWRSPRSAPTATTGCPATRRCGSATRSTTIWCAAISPSTRWRCASRRPAPANSSIPLGGLAALRAGVLDTPAAP